MSCNEVSTDDKWQIALIVTPNWSPQIVDYKVVGSQDSLR